MTSNAFTIHYTLSTSQEKIDFDILVPINPPSLATNAQQLTQYAVDKEKELNKDIKHSYYAPCCVCSDPAQDNFLSLASYLHLPPKGQIGPNGNISDGPFLRVWGDAVCSMAGPCIEKVRETSDDMADVFREGGTTDDRILLDKKKYAPAQFPINGSCIVCHSEGVMKKCSKCKVTHYCSAECQNKDWGRHKQVCKMFLHAKKTNYETNEVVVWK